jgi:hypothetical protein
MPERHAWIPLLREALAMLATAPADQARLNAPGCLACDLMEDFEHARLVATADVSELTDDQRALLDLIDARFEEMEPADYTCFGNTVVERPAWAGIRALANDALRAFGWEETRVAPFEEVQPGVWQRPPAQD